VRVPPLRDRFNRGVGGVSKVFFVERTEGEVLYALTFPVDNLLLERELVQVCTPGGQGSRIPTEVVFAGLAQRLLCQSPPVHIALLRHLAA